MLGGACRTCFRQLAQRQAAAGPLRLGAAANIATPGIGRTAQRCLAMESVAALGAGAAVLGGGVLMRNRPRPVTPPCDLGMQSREVPGTGGGRIAAFLEEDKLVESCYDGMQTLHDVFKRGAMVSNNGPCLGWRSGQNKPYEWVTYNEVLDRAAHFGSGLIALGCKPNQTSFVGIFSQNRVEYVVADQASNMFSMVTVPMYATLGRSALRFIINQAQLETVLCDEESKVMLLLTFISNNQVSTIKRIITTEVMADEVILMAERHGVQMLAFNEVVSLFFFPLQRLGQQQPHEPVLPSPDDLATIYYTSGTTGDPKGAMLTHRNQIAELGGAVGHFQDTIKFGPDDIYISYLPLAHVIERIMQLYLFTHGARIGFYRGDVKELMSDIQALQPTCMATVPRVLIRIHDAVMAKVQRSSLKKRLLNAALQSKEKQLVKGILRRDTIWDKLLLKKVQEQLGGRVRLMFVAGAPISGKILTFTRCAFGANVFEGYGQTEVSGSGTFTIPGDNSIGHVGTPLACNLVKLVDVPDMNYFTEDKQGEVCFKGPNVFKGYLNDKKNTDETIDSDGWVHSGDIGMWLPNGTLRVIDRKKSIFKLAQGEYVAPEKIEMVYNTCPQVAQSFVYGDSLKASLVGIIVPDPDVLISWAARKGIGGHMDALCQNEEVKSAIFHKICTIGDQAGLMGFEQVKDIFLCPDQFTVENGLVTPTFKLKRSQLKDTFQTQIADMYQTLDLARDNNNNDTANNINMNIPNVELKQGQ
ncbi:PREDICTED: long-chain-fatty-acid--CoA ligase 5-like [Branchiostoma belcheri]|uniref:Long-chain-fatty-acid--CoA ligase n=1 Tax=Branchiostoma belcheri TaxID=7741 RepID=A0A6P4YRM2_BRABE|nr:PREDICTED: long-chain-fatty-acid--CoA ligase 5-like [Branchiostoma belcheri]